jgi:hypothetical protein
MSFTASEEKALMTSRVDRNHQWSLFIVTPFAVLRFAASHILAVVVRDREAHLVGMVTTDRQWRW